MNVEKTREYYRNLTADDICDCAYCRNYVSEIRKQYPKLADYLDSIGVNIEQPFEAIPLVPMDGQMIYMGVMYIVMGSSDDFTPVTVEGVSIDITDSHPWDDIEDEFFVIETDEIRLRWLLGDER